MYFFLTKFLILVCYIYYGENMKKLVLVSLFYIILGYFLGSIIFRSKINLINPNKTLYYFLEENNNCLGITKDYEIAQNLKDILEDNGKNITIKKKYLSNKEFSNNISEADNIINTNLSNNEILKVEDMVMETYQEIIKSNTS